MVKPHRDAFSVSVAEKMGWFKAAMSDGELSLQARMALKDVLEHSLQEDIRVQLGVGRHERSPQRRDQRNGYYERSLDTAAGSIENLRVPRSRNGVYEPRVFERYQRRTARVNELILQEEEVVDRG